MKIIIVPREHRKEELDFAKALQLQIQYWSLYTHNHQVDIQYSSNWGNLIEKPSDKADLIISVGGDGTFLRTVSEMKIQCPIIGINFGTVGFLTDVEKDHGIVEIQEIINNPLKIEERMRIDVIYNGKVIGTALNEIAFKSDAEYMVKYKVCVDGITATEFRGDGLIISTPTGSTAYAMSAGGPITDPRIQGFLLVPLAPYLLSARPQIIHESRQVIITADDGTMRIDGEERDFCIPGSVEIKVSTKPALFVDIDRNFFEKVNTKLKVI